MRILLFSVPAIALAGFPFHGRMRVGPIVFLTNKAPLRQIKDTTPAGGYFWHPGTCHLLSSVGGPTTSRKDACIGENIVFPGVKGI